MLLALSGPASGGTALKALLESNSYKDSWVSVGASIDGSRLRLDFEGPWSKGALLYDRDSSLVTLVDHLHKTILALTPDNQATLQLFVTLAATQLKKQEASWNPASLKAFELAQHNSQVFFNGTPRLAEKGVKMEGVPCDKYVTDLETGEKREVWITSPEKAGFSAEDYNTLRSLAHLTLTMGNGLFTQMGADTTTFSQNFYEPQFPMAAVLHSRGKASSQFKVLKIQSQSFGVTAFDLPTGYRNLTMLDLMRQGSPAVTPQN